jgi:drug/metabolite transporter (DMT)-like permease
MSLAVAIPCAVLSAVCYGVSTAVQHSAAHESTGRPDARGLVRLLASPRWLMSVAGDGLGLVLQVAALATGPVVLVQPLLVLAVPVSLPVGWILGGAKPRWRDYAACLGILAALAVFYLVVGDPGVAATLPATSTAVAVAAALAGGAVAVAAVNRRSATLRAAVYGGVAGAWFGLVGVLLDSVATRWREASWAAVTTPGGWAALAGLVVTGALALTLTQVSFQVGALAASFPANEAAAPVVAVVLGAALLHEKVPVSPGAVTAYGACLLVMVTGTVWLARALSGPSRLGGGTDERGRGSIVRT